MHEAQLHDNNCFITLTYNNENIPHGGSLDVRHFQKFMKRLRKRFSGVRFFHCGEYGDHDGTYKHLQMYGESKLGRPHYHAILFGIDFRFIPLEKEGRVYVPELIRQENGNKLYNSPVLSELWPFGFNTVGSVTFESAAYVARYVLKKRFKSSLEEEEHYVRTDLDTGEMHELKPEYVTMSRRPGIGSKWFDQYQSDVYPKDYTTVRGKKIKPPKYYDRLLENVDPELFQSIKAARRASAIDRSDDNTRDRLDTKEVVKQAQINMLQRKLDKEENND